MSVTNPAEPIKTTSPYHFCPDCGTPLAANATYCSNCGSSIPTPSFQPPAWTPTPPPPSLESVPPAPLPQYYAPPGPPSAPPADWVPPPYPPPPPPLAVTPTPPPKKTGGWGKIALIVVAVLVVLGGAGVGALLWFQPQPVISITSDYTVGSTPAGATDTVFHVSGQKFSHTSAITFLLDGAVLSVDQPVKSDAQGALSTDLTVTDSWAVGKHTLTARDANNHLTKSGIKVVIVPQGQAETPGPYDSPSDDESFSLSITIQTQDVQTGQNYTPIQETLAVNDLSSPNKEQVCQSRDNGQPVTFKDTLANGVTYTETVVYTCTGAYQGGTLSYTETATSAKFAFSDGSSCQATSSFVWQQLDGSFSADGISGTYSSDAVSFSCQGNYTVSMDAETGSWTGNTGP